MAKTKIGKTSITIESATEHAGKMKDDAGDVTSLFEDFEKMYALDWTDEPKSKDPNQKPRIVIDPTPRNAVDAVSRLLATSDPQYTVEPQTDSEEGRKVANGIENGVKEIIRRSNRQQNVNAVAESVTEFSIYGRAVLKVTDLRNLLQYRGKSKAFRQVKWNPNQTPIVLRSLHPGTVFYETSDWGLSTVCEIRTRTIGDIKRAWGSAADGLSGDDSTETTFYDYWTYNPFEPEASAHAIWCEGGITLVEPQAHGLDYLPYAIRNSYSLSFLPDKDQQINTMLYTLMKGKTWSRLNLLLTILATNVVLFVNPKYVSKTKDGRQVDSDPNTPGVIPMFVGESFEPVPRDIVPREVYELMSRLSAQQEEATLPRVVSGQAPGGLSAGYAINMLTQSGRLAMYPIESATNDILTDATSIILSHVASGKSDIELGKNLKLSAKDAEEHRYYATAKLRASIPSDKSQIGALWNQIINAGWGSPFQAWEEMGYSDTDKMFDQLLEWIFIQQNIKEMAAGQADEFKFGKKKQEGLPNNVVPTQAQTGQPPPMPQQPTATPPSPDMEQLAQLAQSMGAQPGGG